MKWRASFFIWSYYWRVGGHVGTCVQAQCSSTRGQMLQNHKWNPNWCASSMTLFWKSMNISKLCGAGVFLLLALKYVGYGCLYSIILWAMKGTTTLQSCAVSCRGSFQHCCWLSVHSCFDCASSSNTNCCGHSWSSPPSCRWWKWYGKFGSLLCSS